MLDNIVVALNALKKLKAKSELTPEYKRRLSAIISELVDLETDLITDIENGELQ